MFGPIEVIVGATPEMIHNWGWFLAFGIVLLLLGIAAVARSVTATVASMVFFGWLLMFASLIGLSMRSWLGSGQVSSHTCSWRFCSE